MNQFEPASLEDIEEVKLMDRIDRKYWFHIENLPALLEKAIPFYQILEISGQRLMEYRTTYYDTDEDRMYLNHHNRKLIRYKIRRRKYVATGSGFFEVKRKTNKRRTIKERLKTDFDHPELLGSEQSFLGEHSPFTGVLLRPVLHNHFLRLTLIHRDRLDRCTIDIQPKFWNMLGKAEFSDLVIFELKRGQSLKSSPMVHLLRQMKIRQRGLSKYCTGRALLEPGLKQNAFKPRLRFLEKIKKKENDYALY